ncbi:MAG: hypothetical protein U0470_03280 [Anaerolineae bacterium]
MNAVAVALAVRHEGHDVRADRAQRVGEQGRAGDAVRVVVAVHADPLAGGDGPPDPRDGAVHVGQAERVVVAQPAVEEGAGVAQVRHPARREHPGDDVVMEAVERGRGGRTRACGRRERRAMGWDIGPRR